ncbi:MAG: hypothetical protein KGL55_12530 [Rhodospirillales bacterium]|nr:hypothetical protein [Rhodospirillales bacterium]
MMVALALPSLLLAAGFAVDVGFWYRERARLQLAADAAAMGAARLLGDSAATLSDYQAVAKSEALGATGGQLIGAVNWPATVATSSDETSVTVTLTSQADRYFSRLVPGLAPVLHAVATATAIEDDNACLLALNPSATKALLVTGGGTVNATNCGVFSNSSSASGALYVSGSGKVLGKTVGTSGGVTNSQGTISPTPVSFAAPQSDPYAELGAPPTGTCLTPPPCNNSYSFGGQSCIYSPGTYCTTIAVLNNEKATFQPGIYNIQNGNLIFDGGSTISGSGVAFYLGGSHPGYVGWQNNAKVALSAPTSGPYAGIVLYKDRSASGTNSGLNAYGGGNCNGIVPPSGITDQIAGSASGTLNGAVYMPSGNLWVDNAGSIGPPSGGGFSLIASTMTICGSANVTTTATAPSGGSTGAQVVLTQ